MDETGAMPCQLLEVLFGAVPFMGKEIVVGILPMKLGHQPIPITFATIEAAATDRQSASPDDGAEQDEPTGQ